MLEFRGISKVYGSQHANSEISFSVPRGQIHALIGENGAGKSTLMRLLFGLERPTSGQFFLDGKLYQPENPIDAKINKIGMVHQHFELAGALSALDHIILEDATLGGFFSKTLLPLDRQGWLNKLDKISKDFDMPVPWQSPVQDLSVGIQQRIEIIKLLAFDTEILILDEPTAVLTPQEIEQFLSRLLTLKSAGKTILLISHKLKEVLAVADAVSVLRGGKLVHSGPMKGESSSSLASKMVGFDFHLNTLEHKQVASKSMVKVQSLSATNAFGASLLESINLEIKSGRILGIAGVHGNGQSELLKSLIIPRESKLNFTGKILWNNLNLLDLTNPEIRNLPLGFIPEDRLHQAVIPRFSVFENYQLGRMDFFNGNQILTTKRDSEIQSAIQEFDVRPATADLSFASFSGGNQQKLVVARELKRKPEVLIIAEPTRGVDIGAIELIHRAIIAARNEGVAILLISSELDELIRLSDELLVMSRGKVAAHFERQEFNLSKIGESMGGAK